jgi:signal peptidase I
MSETPAIVRGGWGRALWAGLLSLIQPGLGQVYAGKWRLGVGIFAIAVVLNRAVIGLTLAAAPSPAVVAILFVLCIVAILIWLGAAIHAVRCSRKSPNRLTVPWQQSTWIAAIAMLGFTFGVAYFAGDTLGWRTFSIPSGSNVPTLMIGDYAVADARRPMQLPTYGDMIVFHKSTPPAADYVKRVVGLPGDRIQLKQGILYLNGKALPRELLGPYSTKSVGGVQRPYKRYRETLPGGRSYEIVSFDDSNPFANTPEFRVPPLHYFVLGDNRDDSLDSRSLTQIGYVPQASIIGAMQTIFWSPDLSRIFKHIE